MKIAKITFLTYPVGRKFRRNHSISHGLGDMSTFAFFSIQISQLLIYLTRLGQLGANISPDRSSLTPQVLIGNFLFNPFVVCHKSWEKLYELQHINLLSLYLPKEDGVSPDAEYITQQIIFSIFLQ